MYRPGLGRTVDLDSFWAATEYYARGGVSLGPAPAITVTAPGLPEATQRALAMTMLPDLVEAERAAARQFNEQSWWVQYSTPILLGAGTLVALMLFRGRR